MRNLVFRINPRFICTIGILFFVHLPVWSQSKFVSVEQARIDTILEIELLQKNLAFQQLKVRRDTLKANSINWLQDKYQWAMRMINSGCLSLREMLMMEYYLKLLEQELKAYHRSLDLLYDQARAKVLSHAQELVQEKLKAFAKAEKITMVFNTKEILYQEGTMEDITAILLQEFMLTVPQIKKDLELQDTYPTFDKLKARFDSLNDYGKYKRKLYELIKLVIKLP